MVDQHQEDTVDRLTLARMVGRTAFIAVLCSLTLVAGPAGASHQAQGSHPVEAPAQPSRVGRSIPGASFQVLWDRGKEEDAARTDEAAVQTVIDTFIFMVQHRTDYPRFDESLKKDALKYAIVQPAVANGDGKAFPFLVVRTHEPGRVNLLISASSLNAQGYLNHPEELAPVLAREFQWVVSKAETAKKSPPVSAARDSARAPVRADHEILAMPGEERGRILQQLFTTYLSTVDEQKSLEGQPYYEVGTSALVQPTQADSAIKLYDIRVRQALRKIVTEPYFQDRTPKAVRSLLNGKIWNVSFAKIDQRDWATRTRVLPEDKAVAVGEQGRVIQPATILVNTYRTAAPDDPFYRETNGLPMGALSADQLARVIAREIEGNIIEKSMRGHVAQDELTAPK
jgi:hypothetical protein